MTDVPVLGNWRNNAGLFADGVRPLGWITDTDTVLDPTYGTAGGFWTRWRPAGLIASDLNPEKSPTGSVDATALPYLDGSIDVVVLDPPYKLNGRPDPVVDARYGVDERSTVEDRLAVMDALLIEGCRVGNRVLFKCQDQVVSGRRVWQTHRAVDLARLVGFEWRDQLMLRAGRAQPARSTCSGCGAPIMRRADGRWGTVRRGDNFSCLAAPPAHAPMPGVTRQQHARSNVSVLLRFDRKMSR